MQCLAWLDCAVAEGRVPNFTAQSMAAATDRILAASSMFVCWGMHLECGARRERAHFTTGPNGNCKEDDDQSAGKEDRTPEQGCEEGCPREEGCRQARRGTGEGDRSPEADQDRVQQD